MTEGICGIYAIRNKLNGKTYVGSSVQVVLRWRTHRSSLKMQKHHAVALQRAWDCYGESSFEFVMLEELSVAGLGKGVQPKLLIEREQWFLDSGFGQYNSKRIASNRAGQKWSEEVRKQKAKQLRSLTSDPAWREEHSRKIKALWKNPEWRAVLVAALKEIANRPEVREKRRQDRVAYNKKMGAMRHGPPRKFISESGEEQIVTRLVDFAREIGVLPRHVSNVVRGLSKKVNGWKLVGDQR